MISLRVMGISFLFLTGAGMSVFADLSVSDLEKTWQTVSERTVPEKVSREAAEKWLRSQRADGSWADIDYAAKNILTGEHQNRLRAFARIWRNSPDSQWIRAIERGLIFWSGKEYFGGKLWWHRDIGRPLVVSEIFFLLGPDVTTRRMLEAAKPWFDRISTENSAGQNRQWLASVIMNRGIFFGDPESAMQGRTELLDTICVVEAGKEGIQADGAYHQHGPQLQFGNYGRHALTTNLRFAEMLAGTKLAFPREKIKILARYFADGPRWTIWKKALDLSACSRYIGPKTERRMFQAYSEIAASLKRLVPESAVPLDPGEGCKYFSSSDFLVVRRKDWYFSLRMCSSRVIGSETVANENLKGRLMGNGLIQIRRDNGEYRDIPPFWNWRKLPGITAPENFPEKELVCPGAWKKTAYFNESPLVAGWTDGKIAAAMQEIRHGTFRAKKSVFVFDRYILFLGSSISAGSVTTVNSCFLRGGCPVRPGKFSGTSLLHDNVEYLFPEGGNLELEPFERSGRWRDVIAYLPDTLLKARLFTLVWRHPKENGSYFYAVRPVADDGSKADFLRLRTSSPDIHAVLDRTEGRGMAAFYCPGRIFLPNGKILERRKPGIVNFSIHGAGRK